MGMRGSVPRSVDLLVIGGGINGTGIARDAAGRGLDVLLCEQDDLAAHTSSASTKLIHGGLRYLEHRDFRLVRQSLRERAILLRNAPHIIWPLRFVLPHHAGLRPWWMIRLGLFLYDHLGGSRPAAAVRERRPRPARERARVAGPLSPGLRVLGLLGAGFAARGAQRPRRPCEGGGGPHPHRVRLARAGWHALDGGPCRSGVERAFHRHGAWRRQRERSVGGPSPLARGRCRGEAQGQAGQGEPHRGAQALRPRHPYIFQTGDGRVLFAIPYEEDYTLLGTTDVEFEGAPGRVEITPQEVDYICAAANDYFETSVTPRDVVWTYSGIRPLFDDHAENASEVTRDYVLHLDPAPAPMLSVYGGKITTYRRLAERAVDMLAGPLRAKGSRWTADAPLPGGDIPNADIGAFTAQCATRYSWLPERLLRHFIRHYGTDILALLAGRSSVDDLGEHFGARLYAAEVAYLVEHEWARTAEDILWRRTRKGLGVSAAGVERLRAYLQAR